MKEWLTAAEIAAENLPFMPATTSAVVRRAKASGWNESHLARPRSGRGGGLEYSIQLLPVDARAAYLARHSALLQEEPKRSVASTELWERFERLPTKQKNEAQRRFEAVERVDQMSYGATRQAAVAFVARDVGVSTSTLWNWVRAAAKVSASDRLAALAPRYKGRTATASVSPEAWDFLKADWLRPEAPNFEACFRRLERAAKEQGWTLPSAKTLRRRLDRELPRAVQTLARRGTKAVQAIYPHQTRDRSVFHAMQAVNADGHKFDVFVRWPDGSVSRPLMVAIQDLYSGMMLAHRIGESESWPLVRHAFADMVESWGIPESATLDNGRAFASKWLTGKQKSRFRFKIREDEPEGVLTTLGIKVNWATPYHGQAKPIERAFRDLCEDIAKHPRFAGAYTGNRPDAKPENYASKAIPIETFRAVVAEEIRHHNERPGRRATVCAGRSLAETFSTSYEQALIKGATEAQRRMLLMAAEGVTASKRNGEVMLADNRYWAEPLVDFAGRKVTVRFDPDDLLAGIAVYAVDGRFLCEAPCIEATGFNDMAAAQKHGRDRRAWMKAQREMLRLETRLSIDDLADMLPAPAETPAPERKVTKLVTAGNAALKHDEDSVSDADAFSRAMERLASADIVPIRSRSGG
ncbi:transposase domain-containing protein [Breoghania sp.]|uniref:transposase domain-containing protein n=1 Tax=Breoghania sp. TaxID=2065378 RepID=UPI0029CA816B|nr:transposase domain-containing protein [Breoghania sp.]